MGATLSASKGRTRRGRRRTAPMSEINVTPFVDVMLVLLIIFMVAAPLLTVGVPLELPKTSAQSLPTEQEEPLTVNIDADGVVYLQTTAVPYTELLPKLTAIRESRGEDGGKVFLRADGGLDYGRVAQVMADLRNAGFASIGLVTDQAQPAVE
ncbi:protein TolR [Rhodobacteraceae bacterium NNCM2]|nr:protein TolR [Coraliihabitans acroporae]